MTKRIITILAAAVMAFTSSAALVDVDGNPATNETYLADIDMAAGTLGDLKQEIAPTKTSQLQNDSGFATTGQVHTAVSNLNAFIEANTNFVRRTDTSFSIAGTGNQLGMFSSAIGSNNTLANRSAVFGFNNRLLSPSYGNAQQYAFGFGNKSQAQNNFIVGMGSGATEDGQDSISLGTMSVSTNFGSFVWNYYPTDYSSVDADQIFDIFPKYYSHGDGTFNINPIGGLRGVWIGETNLQDHIYQTIAAPIVEAAAIVDHDLKQFVTNTVVVGYTDWVYTGDIDPTAKYSITSAQSAGNFVFTLWNMNTSTQLGTVTTNEMNATVLVFSVTAGHITATRSEIRRNANGFAMYSDVQEVSQKIDEMDTSYIRSVGLTNVNQSVQYVYADQNVTELQILMPTTGVTKDWIVYVLSQTNVVLKLPAANYWCSNESVTNDIPGLTPTALYFSQINDDTYSISRRELIPITVSSQQNMLMQAVRQKMSSKKLGMSIRTRK